MKPTNKYQRFIVAENEKIKPLSYAQERWMEQRTTWRYATNHYKKTCCLECNHQWEGNFPEKKKTIKCPSCKKTLREMTYNGRGTNTEGHGVIFDKVGAISVVRIVYVRKYLSKNELPTFQTVEVARKFYDPINRKYSIMNVGMNGMMGSYQGGWNLNKELSLKRANPTDYRTRIGYVADIYPNKKIPKEITRMGFTFKNHTKISHDDFMWGIVTDPRCETLLKNGEHEFLEMAIYNNLSDDLWTALKICFRRYYHIPSKNVQDYADYIRLLSYFGKDLHSDKYVCPEDFHKAHQRLVAKKERINRKQRELDKIANHKRQVERAKKQNNDYIERTKRYFDLLISDKNIVIEVMKSVDEFIEVGKDLKHCIFQSEYFNKKNSLVLSAKIDGVAVETIEVDLNTMKVSQSRGFDNKITKLTPKIIKMVEKYIPEIKKLHQKAA